MAHDHPATYSNRMSSPVRYVVRRQEFTPPTAAGVRRVLPEKWTAVATFAKPADAHAECVKQLTQARRTLNPFQLGGPNLFYQTSLPAYALHDYLLDHGLTPPPTATSSNPNYVFWWVKHNRTFTDAERAVVWRACDKLGLFKVVEEDDRQAVWLVVETAFKLAVSSSQYGGIAKGGYLRSAHATQQDANRRCRALRSSLHGFTLPDELEAVTAEDLASVRSVPLVGEPVGGEVSVLCHHDIADDDWAIDMLPSDPVERPLVPDMAYTSMNVSVAALATRVGRSRRTVNPFDLLDKVVRYAGWLRFPSRNSAELPNGLSVEDAFAAVRRLDTTPPPPESDELLADWYDQVVQWSPEYIDVIWGTFADFRLFEVVEVPLG